MKTQKDNIQTLEQFKDEHYGKLGTAKRDQLEAGFENFKMSALIQEVRIEKGMTPGRTCRKGWNNEVLYFKA